MNKFLQQTILILLLLSLTESIKVQQWVTRSDDNQQTLLTRWNDLDLLKTVNPTKKIHIQIDPNLQKNILQNMQGFGCALTQSSATVLLALKKTDYFQYVNLLESLFGPSGISMNMLRIPISSSDFSFDEYSLNDEPINDSMLSGFSMEKLNRYIIPALRDILIVNQQIQLMLTPWTGPAWIKDNPSLHYGTLKNEYIDTWALYLAKSVEGFEAALKGIDSNPSRQFVHSVTLQNEPLHDPCDYACMRMSTQQQARVSQSLRTQLDALGSTAKILVFDHNWEDYWYPIEVFSFLGVKEAAAGAAFHCYGGDVKQQSLFYEAVRKEVHLTECSGGEWSPDFKSNINFAVGTLAIGGTLHHAQSVLLWNLALDNKYGPHVGGCSNCRGFITGHRPDKDLENVVPQIIDGVSQNVEYYSIGHFSKFIDDSFNRLNTDVSGSDCLLAAAFFSQLNHKTTIVINNQCSTPVEISITDKDYGSLNMDFVAPGILTLYYDYAV